MGGHPTPQGRLPHDAHTISNQPEMLLTESHRQRSGLSPELISRQLSNLSTISGTSGAASRQRSKKAAIWTEKYNSTTVVFGPVHSHESFKRLFDLIKANCNDVKSHYYRETQLCGFVYFHSGEATTHCINRFHLSLHDGNCLTVASPTEYFENEEDACPQTYINNVKGLPPVSAPRVVAQEPSATLVLRNLCFGLKQGKLLEFLTCMTPHPQSVSYHFDANGLFRGVAFIKYSSGNEAMDALKLLSDAEFDGRRLKVEFKRRPTTTGIIPINLAAALSVLSPSVTPTSSSPPRDPAVGSNKRLARPQQVQFAGPNLLVRPSTSDTENNVSTNDQVIQIGSPLKFSIQSQSDALQQQQQQQVRAQGPMSLFSSDDDRPSLLDGFEFDDFENHSGSDDIIEDALVQTPLV
eukprot:c6350_g1_i1.p1 GENE.c6350_g1_i1~~c6350_g1_i1.p1  ORF type:complete len:409 (+),score=88.91 c6350_g1_i1:1-1227(+)